MTALGMSEFSRTIRADRVPPAGIAQDLVANAGERASLALRFGLVSVEELQASVTLKPLGGGNLFRLTGHFVARVTQTCVVTLEPLPAVVEEDFALTFGSGQPEDAGEIELFMDEEDPPDPIIDGMIDMGEAVAEHVALSLDPFPRKPGVTFDDGAPEAPVEEKRPGPFAKLAQLRKNKG